MSASIGTQDFSQTNELESMKNPNVLGQSIAWLFIVSGIAAIMMSLTMVPDAFGVVGFSVFGLGYLIPSIWWLRCKKIDRKNAEAFELERKKHDDLLRYLSDEDELIRSGIGEVEQPKKKDRRWGPAIGISFVVFSLGMVLFSFSEEVASQPGGSPWGDFNETEN